MSSEPSNCNPVLGNTDSMYEDEWRREIARRIEDYERNPSAAIPGELVLAELCHDLTFQRTATSSTIPNSLIEAALALPAEAREEFANILLDSLQPPIEPEILKAIAEQAKRRVTAYERGEMKAISQEEFLASRREKWGR